MVRVTGKEGVVLDMEEREECRRTRDPREARSVLICIYGFVFDRCEGQGV